MLEYYEIENLEQLRAISDMMRVRIVDLLQQRPMTVTQLGELMGLAPGKVHYHVRELEKVGLLRLVETREKGGILEKYYQPIAKELLVPKGLLLSAPPDEVLATTMRWFDQIKEGFQRTLHNALEKNDVQRFVFGFSRMYMTQEEQKQLGKHFEELFKGYAQPRGIEGEQEIQSMVLLFPQETAANISEMDPTALVINTWSVGSISYNKADLENALRQGKRLRINVVGFCQIDDDVSADLAERAIEQFSLVGKLQASMPVQEVLQRKRSDSPPRNHNV